MLYLLIPLCALLLILQSYPEIPSDRMYMRIYWVIPTATIIVILAQLSSLYRKGEARRFLLNIGFTAMTILWMFGLLGGGVVMTTQWNEYEFSLHMGKYVLLIICVAILNVLYYTLEWRVYRKDKAFLPSSKKKITGIRSG
jgi:heme A synthase